MDSDANQNSVEDLAREFDISPAEFARRLTEFNCNTATERLDALGSYSYEDLAREARQIGIPAAALLAMIPEAVQGPSPALTAHPFTEDKLESARLSPPAIVENYIYQDLAILAGPGGSNKTTLALWESVHIALGRPLYGLPCEPTRSLFVTGEDNWERIAARLNAIMHGLDLSSSDRSAVISNVWCLDLAGRPFRLCELDKNGNIATSDDVSRFIDAFRGFDPGIVSFDPLASFGAPEETVNAAAQGVVNAARRIIRELRCCVRILHHTGQYVARENLKDQYAPRGGSALSDGARMVAVISRPKESEPPPIPAGPDDHVFVLSRAKCNYCAPQPDIFIQRHMYKFEYMLSVKETPEERSLIQENQVHQFLVDQLARGNKYTARAMEEVLPAIKLTQKQLREAIARLRLGGRIVNVDLPEQDRQGGKKTYLNPTALEKNSA